MYNFTNSRIPMIITGPQKWKEIPVQAKKFGTNLLLVLGSKSFEQSKIFSEFISTLQTYGLKWNTLHILDEPNPQLIDELVKAEQSRKPDVVVAIGGGSVLDAGKAISAMIPLHDSVTNYLEGIGTKMHPGTKIPFIAVPTTSGTGSEATKNAVLSTVGKNGYKKSLRHDNFIPEIAILDPTLMVSCPPSLTASCGLDAFTQLMEAYVSTKANVFTDALAISGLKAIGDNLILACGNGSSDVNVRAAMAYGALMSGITLANSGLGLVHGLAGPIGGYFKIPHGVACGTLIAETTKANIQALKTLGAKGKEFLLKHAITGALFQGKSVNSDSEIEKYCDILVSTLDDWVEKLHIPKLNQYGITKNDLITISKSADLKNNPVKISEEKIMDILTKRF